jgi:predicted dehydrogenase
MSKTLMKRRDLLKGIGFAVSGAPALLSKLNANDRIGVACIGLGIRGPQLMREARDIPNVEIRVISDLYTDRVERGKIESKNPKVRFEHDWQKAVTDPDVDVVINATPDFWHSTIVLAAADAKKDIYTEKGWCTNLEDAKKMRKMIKDRKVVMQLGHQYRASPYIQRAREICRSGQLGAVNTIRTITDRTSPWQYMKYYGGYFNPKPPEDASPQTIDWEAWQAIAARKYPFSVDRFFTWRCYWDYGTGIAGDLMTHLWDAANFIMGMGIPETVCTQGGIYFWKKDRTVPDNWNVMFDYPHKDLSVSFSCSLMNEHQLGGDYIGLLGREQTLETNTAYCRTYDAEWKPEVQKRNRAYRAAEVAKGMIPSNVVLPPDYTFKYEGPPPPPGEFPGHMEDFINCVRTRGTPSCNVDQAFEEAAALCMSVESFKQDRKVRWDKVNEEIV